jgi:hypothetical protein
MMILAQIGGNGSASGAVPMLPSPPLLAHYFLENPWPVVAGLVVGSLVAAYVLNRRGRLKEALRMLAVGIVLAVSVWILASSVMTEREVLQARTRLLVDLTADVRTGDLADMLTESISVDGPKEIASPRGREQVLQAVRQSLTSLISIKEHTTGPVTAIVDGPNVARTQVRVWVKLKGEAAFYEGPLGAWFRIGWTRAQGTGDEPDGQWHVTSISVLQIDGVGVTAKPGE